MLSFPTVYQSKDFDCSAACAKAVEQHYGVHKPLAHYVNSLSVERASGCDPRTLDRFFRKAGYGVIAGEMTLADLRFHTDRNRPVICPITLDGEGHYVVVYWVSQRLGTVTVADPWHGHTSMRGDEFVAGWRDHDAVETFQQWGVAVRLS